MQAEESANSTWPPTRFKSSSWADVAAKPEQAGKPHPPPKLKVSHTKKPNGVGVGYKADVQCLRVTMPFCFGSHNWRQCQSKPTNIIAGLLNDNGIQDGLIATHGWRT